MNTRPKRELTFDAPSPHTPSVWNDDKVQERIAYDIYREERGHFHPHDPRGRARTKDSAPQFTPEQLQTLQRGLAVLQKIAPKLEAMGAPKPAPAPQAQAVQHRKLGDFVFEDEPRPTNGDQPAGSIDGPEILAHDIYTEAPRKTLDHRQAPGRIPLGHDIYSQPEYRQLGAWCLDDTAPHVRDEDRARWV